MKNETDPHIEAAALATADPSRAQRNLERFIAALDKDAEPVKRDDLKAIALLFSTSQFLANHSARRPGDLLWALQAMRSPVTRSRIIEDSLALLEANVYADESVWMDKLRVHRKRWLMAVSMRDLMGMTNLVETMQELSFLAEAAIEIALKRAINTTIGRHGEPEGGGREIGVIALGKLGGMEINYSSDIDLMFVCVDREGKTEGQLTSSGARVNRVSPNEFYIKVAEIFSVLLNKNTDEGIAYRVDTRLRPGGQKGELVMPLSAYKRYYDTWGRTWERLALIRARPVGGDPDIGKAFLSVVESFVWHRPEDYQEIEEIRSLKKKIDSTFTRDDIKRGYGGIREAEFFVQTFQLLYGTGSRPLRSFRLMEAMQGLKRMALVPEDEIDRLADVYLYFRRLEHYLQMLDDLQTYRIPSSDSELLPLARKMGFDDIAAFMSDLRLRRMSVKDMYNSLLGTQEDVYSEALALMEDDFSDAELRGYLAFKGAIDTSSALESVKYLRENLNRAQTSSERAMIRHRLPHLLDMALRESGVEQTLRGLEGFLSSFGMKDAYLSALTNDKGLLARGMMRIFSMSTEMTRLFLSSPGHMNWLVESMPIRKSLMRQRAELRRLLEGHHNLNERLIKFKSVEWLRLAMLFFLGIIDIYDLNRSLSHLADVISEIALDVANPDERGLCIMAMGKHGSREITFGSDLDVIFISDGQADKPLMAARALKTLTSYHGIDALYEVDTRLRPDGNKGELVKTMEGYKKYYSEHAQPWEVQALLKARPVAGDMSLAREFMSMAREIALRRGAELTREAVAEMRGRIVSQLGPESEGLNLKLARGGMGEIEFYVQRLQLNNLGEHPSLMVQNTGAAIDRLCRHAGLLSRQDSLTLSSVYDYYKKLSTFQRVNGIKTLNAKDASLYPASVFMGHRSVDEMMKCIGGYRETVLKIVGQDSLPLASK